MPLPRDFVNIAFAPSIVDRGAIPCITTWGQHCISCPDSPQIKIHGNKVTGIVCCPRCCHRRRHQTPGCPHFSCQPPSALVDGDDDALYRATASTATLQRGRRGAVGGGVKHGCKVSSVDLALVAKAMGLLWRFEVNASHRPCNIVYLHQRCCRRPKNPLMPPASSLPLSSSPS